MTREQINEFLTILKELMEKKFIFVPRRKNMESLEKLALLPAHIKELVMHLTIENYCDGPHPDHQGVGEIWVFGIEIDGKNIYLKLKVDIENEIARCISFHEAEFVINYPMKEVA